MNSNGIGARIRKAREDAGKRQVQVAAETGLALGTIRNYELELTAHQIANLRLIADSLGVDVLWLIDGDRVGEVV